jgi:hypothetical protein
VTFLLSHLTGGLRLLSASAVAYFTSALLLGIAVVPAALRSYQLFTGTGNGWLELLVELLRAVLIIAMARQTADAVVFAIKNVVVIPLFLMTTLVGIRAVHPGRR